MYKCYIFDLDGTIIDSEKYHYEAYKKQCPQLTFVEYQRIFHDEALKKIYIKENNINKALKEEDFKLLYKQNKKYIPGSIDYINNLILNNKDIVIVTNSSTERCNFIKKMHPELVNVKYWITKTIVKNKKPNPEGFIKAMNLFSYNIDEYVIFEDSYTGVQATQNLNVAKGWVMSKDYYYIEKIGNDISFTDYENVFINKSDHNNYSNINNKLSSYSSQFISNFQNFQKNIYCLSSYILYNKVKSIYMCGIGKSNYILKKCASSWRSIGINVQVLDCENLFHGEFSLFNDNDLLILASNSGNTMELVNLVEYLNNNFNVMKVIVSNRKTNKLSEICDLNLTIGNEKFIEADIINMVPSVSSMMFLIFFDMVGIYLSEKSGLTVSDFKKYHPSGELGKNSVIKNNIVDYVIISACGKGTRLYPMTKNIPKFLVNSENKNFLTMMLEYWSNYSTNFIIILDDIYNDIVNYYIEQYNESHSKKIIVEVINVKCPDGYENSFTLSHGIPEKCYNKNVLVTWCDILPEEKLFFPDKNDNIIFTYKTYSRYKACQETQKINKQDKGNIVGIYYFNNFKKLKTDNYKKDLCDVFITNYNTFKTSEISSLIDIGDKEKYLFETSNNGRQYKTRFFNDITKTTDNTLIKTCIDPDFGKNIFEDETKHYRIISILNTNKYKLFPEIYSFSDNSIELELIEGKNIYSVPITNDLIQKFIDKLSLLHSLKSYKPSKDSFDRDVKIEFFTKLNTRLQNILPILSHFKKYIFNVNNRNIDINLDTIKNIVNDHYIYIKSKLEEKNITNYHTIHGDCQFSNSMITNGEIIFIDPRGYFGKTKNYGLKEYDYSKLLYALSGYDNFNNDITYCFDYKDNNSIVLNMPSLEKLESYRSIFEKNNIDFNICVRMVIMHWLALADYNKNNIIKCISSIFIGLFLHSEYVN